MPGSPLDFFFGPEHLPAVLARLHRDLAESAMRPDQVAPFFQGPGAEAASSLALATGLLSAGHRGPTPGPPAFRPVHQLTA
jgi:hypothetical protein